MQIFSLNHLRDNIFLSKSFKINTKLLTAQQKLTFWILVLLFIAVKIIIIPYNMMDAGDNATRVWNALWWAQNPFFVLPASGHPLWFYFMGPIIKITGEIFYSPIISMIILMTISDIFIFRTALLLTNFRAAILAFIIVTLNPLVFRLNFQPYAQQLFITAACIMLYYLIKAFTDDSSKKYFIIAGVFAFLASASRPEVIFTILAVSLLVYLSKKPGAGYFVIIALSFQVFWIILSYAEYGSFFKSFEIDSQYSTPLNIQGISMGLRLKGLFVPYYYLVLGLTIFIFYYYVKGLIYFYGNYPKSITYLMLILIIMPLLICSAAGVKSPLYQSTNYMYLPFFISPVFCAVGLINDMNKIRHNFLRTAFAALLILSCIPLSYIKEFVPSKYSNIFPKVIQFIVTADEPAETKILIKYIDENIKNYPSFIFDAEENASSIFYVPFRTRLAPPEKVLITGYNVPLDKNGLKDEVIKFMKKNQSGIIMYRKSPTMMNSIINELLSGKIYTQNQLILSKETNKWFIYNYDLRK